MRLKEFEKKEIEWWCNHYRLILRDLSIRARQFVEGEIEEGVLMTFVETLEQDREKRDKLV
jgi:hypothetical protein